MRLRNIKGADEAVAESIYCIQNPRDYRGNWHTLFSNTNPIHMEIGMGKGKFIMELASQNPSVNYIGVERYTSVLYRALQKMETETLPNLKFLCVDAKILPEIFAPGEIDKIYLNFSDPWPKDRHAKRRLTSGAFLSCYDSVLKPEGTIEFKTDNKGLFDFSMEEIPGQGWKINASTTDLHRDTSMNQGNVMTEYEEKFSAMGNPIYKLIASR
ncbi:MAG: tRNA (guanosine(46)-N7)-methyltransferase TrmB [Lachnospiraceae bacterium]|nr:tRNA (guanosine(46)-N7)-methyltransferase TrmB [Lachnospiraceae bacterium]